MQQGTFSDQFMSASLDGTIKVWDLQLKLMKKPYQKSETNSRFGRPKNLMSNKSPLSHLNNRLRPSYSVRLTFLGTYWCNTVIVVTHSPFHLSLFLWVILIFSEVVFY